jgi:hypothetical protein
MYRHCLLNGVRCLEIDMWDGSNGQPIVTHGHTLVSKIPLEEVCLPIIPGCGCQYFPGTRLVSQSGGIKQAKTTMSDVLDDRSLH